MPGTTDKPEHVDPIDVLKGIAVSIGMVLVLILISCLAN